MLKISEFARLVQISTKTLRHYDKIGLLEPAYIEPMTNYRYYSIAQLHRLNRILALKGLDLSLEQIAQILDDDLSAEQIRGMLRLKQAQIQARLAEEQARLAYVEAKIQQIENEGKMSDHEILIKNVPGGKVASIRDVSQNQADLPQVLNSAFGELRTYIQQSAADFSDNPYLHGVTIYHVDEEWHPDEPKEVEAIFGVDGDLAPQGRIQVYDLPEVELMACVLHDGPFATMLNAYNAILQWIGSSDYVICGPSREVTLSYDPNTPDRAVTEIQFPVRKP
jgi:DNA-binding transcriptional MerR regulator